MIRPKHGEMLLVLIIYLFHFLGLVVESALVEWVFVFNAETNLWKIEHDVILPLNFLVY